jgi:hypothetical protein
LPEPPRTTPLACNISKVNAMSKPNLHASKDSSATRPRVPLCASAGQLVRQLSRALPAVAAAVAPFAAGAGIVHIEIKQRAGTEYGAGFTVGRGKECFIVTPFHVVQFAPADSITVADTKGSTAKARVLKGSQEFDAALLQIVGESALDCPADWSDGANAVSAIGSTPFLIARKVDDTGRVMQTRLFASSTSREQMDLQPFGPSDELREGDSGSAVYAGDALVGLMISVDTKSRTAHALTQSQIHGLFGADVLPAGKRTALLQPFTQRNVENAYATATARDYLVGPAGVQLVTVAADGKPPAGTDYVIAGQLVDVTNTRAANPNYKPPEKTPANESLGKQLLRNLEKRASSEVDEALARNSQAQYLRTYNVDVQVQITKVADGSKSVNLERRSFVLPEIGNLPDIEKTAVSSAVKEALELTLKKYPL